MKVGFMRGSMLGLFVRGAMERVVIGCVLLWALTTGLPIDECIKVPEGSNITLYTTSKTEGFVLIKHDITMKFEIVDGKLRKCCPTCAYRDGLAILTNVKPDDAGIYYIEHMDHDRNSICLSVTDLIPEKGLPIDECRNVPEGSNITLYATSKTEGFVLIKHNITMKFEIVDGKLRKCCPTCAYRDGLAILTNVKPDDAGIYYIEHMDHDRTSICLSVTDLIPEKDPDKVTWVAAIAVATVVVVIALIIFLNRRKRRSRPGPGESTL